MTSELHDEIRKAYRETTKPGQWKRIADLHYSVTVLTGADADEVKDAITSLAQDAGVDVMPESNRKILRQADLRWSVWCGGEYNHLIKIS